MRSRTSRGVLEWSGDEDLYMGSPYSVAGSVQGFTGIVLGPPKGFRGSTYPGGPYGLNMEENQPLGGQGANSPRAHAPRVGGNPKGGAPT